MRYVLARLLPGHRVQPVKAFHHLAVAELPVGGHDGGVAVEARARLGPFLRAPRLVLVREHVGVTALFAVVDPEGIALEDPPPPGILVEPLEGLAPAVPRPGSVHRLAVAVVLAGEVLPHSAGSMVSSVSLTSSR
jgi:hypothetical protein